MEGWKEASQVQGGSEEGVPAGPCFAVASWKTLVTQGLF